MSDDETPPPDPEAEGTDPLTDDVPRVTRRRRRVAGTGSTASAADPDAGGESVADPDAVSGPDQANPDARSRRRLIVGAVALLAVVALLVGFVVWRSGDETVAPKPVAATTTTSIATTTSSPNRVATDALVATSSVPKLAISSTPPADWDTATPVVAWDSQPPPSSAGTLPPRPALPRPDYPLQGRYSTATGWSFDNPTSFKGPLTLLVTEQRGPWLKVLVPVRPNGGVGWVAAGDVTLSHVSQHIDLHIADRKLQYFNGAQLVAETQVVVGKDETRTPTGLFFITDKVPQSDPNGFYGPIALATSAYSEQLDEFENGVPVIALHGTNRPELVGTAASNGCVRIPNDIISQIAKDVPLGTPVNIYA